MTNQNDQTETGKPCKSGWEPDEKRKIAAMVYPMLEMQKAYGRTLDPALVMQGWEAFLSDEFTADQICYALKKYALDVGDDFPTPKNLKAILCPEKPRITEAEFVAAQKWQERNGYPIFSEAKDVIDAYRAQEHEQRNQYKVECDKVRRIALESVKRIEQV